MQESLDECFRDLSGVRRKVGERHRACTLIAREFILKDATAWNFIIDGGLIMHSEVSNRCVKTNTGAPFPSKMMVSIDPLGA